MILHKLPVFFAAFLALIILPVHAKAMVYGGVFSSQEEQAAVLAAERAHEFRDFDEAWRLVLDAVEEFPSSLEARRLKVLVASSMNRISELLVDYHPDTVAEEERYIAHYMRGWIAVLSGDPRVAVRELERAQSLLDSEPPFEIERALLVARRMVPGTNPKDLAENYEQFLDRWQDVPLAYVSVLNYYNFTRPGDRTRWRLVRWAIDSGKALPAVYIAAARLEENRFWFDPAKGLEWIDKGLELHPDSTDLALRRILYLRQLGQTEEALDYVREWRTRASNHGDFRVDEIDIYSDMGMWPEAIEATLALQELVHQDQYLEGSAVRLARLYHFNNQPRRAIAVLTRFLDEQPASRWRGEAASFLTRLQTRGPEDRVRILPSMPYLTQRGNYCGPATVSMVLGYWGMGKGQDAIAERVYTGIAGTPPQVIREYARTLGLRSVEFAGTQETWRRLIDAGFPILWLQFMREGGHYRVVTGYDDIHQSWIVHDPNNFRRHMIAYDEVDDLWILPNVVRSIVIFPDSRADDPALAGLAPTPMMSFTNGVLYIATGSNLFVGLFPAVLINIMAGTLLALLIAWQLRRVTFPSNAIRYVWVVGMILGIIIPGNLLIGLFRLSGVVSLLLGFHLALLTLVPLLLFASFALRYLKDYFHRRESLGVGILCVLVWLALSFIDRDPWQWIVPVGLFVVGMPIAMWPRLGLRRVERLYNFGDTPGAVERARDFGLEGRNYYSALCVELECLLTLGRITEFIERARVLEKANHDNRDARALFSLCVLLGEALLPDAEINRRELSTRLAQFAARGAAPRLFQKAQPAGIIPGAPVPREARVPRQLAMMAAGIQLYVDHNPDETTITSQDYWTKERIDALLVGLADISGKRLPGSSRSRTLRGRAIVDTVLLLAMIGATRSAQREAERDRLMSIWKSWSSRYALLVSLLGHLEQPKDEIRS